MRVKTIYPRRQIEEDLRSPQLSELASSSSNSSGEAMSPRKRKSDPMGNNQGKVRQGTEKQPLKPPSAALVWRKTSIAESDLSAMVARGVLPPKDVINWRACLGEEMPGDAPYEIPVFTWQFERGLGLPVCSFFRGLLHYYKLDFWHLPPNSIMAVAIFIHFYEAYLGIAPHFDLFRYLYAVKVFMYDKKLSYVGGAGFVMRQGRAEEYFKLLFFSSVKFWQNEWFIVENHNSSIPKTEGSIAQSNDAWTAMPPREEGDQIAQLLERIQALKASGLTATAVAIDFVYKNIQPLKDRDHSAFYYRGLDDRTRETDRQTPVDEVVQRVRGFFQGPITNRGAPKSFTIWNPPSEEDIAVFVSEPPLPENDNTPRKSQNKEILGKLMLKYHTGESSSGLPQDIHIDIGSEGAGEQAKIPSEEASEPAAPEQAKQKKRTRRATAKRPASKVVTDKDVGGGSKKKAKREYRAPPSSSSSSDSGNPKLERREQPRSSEGAERGTSPIPPSPTHPGDEQRPVEKSQAEEPAPKSVTAPKPKPALGRRRLFPQKQVPADEPATNPEA